MVCRGGAPSPGPGWLRLVQKTGQWRKQRPGLCKLREAVPVGRGRVPPPGARLLLGLLLFLGLLNEVTSLYLHTSEGCCSVELGDP